MVTIERRLQSAFHMLQVIGDTLLTAHPNAARRARLMRNRAATEKLVRIEAHAIHQLRLMEANYGR